MSCEKCWNDAFVESRRTGESQAEAYQRLLDEVADHKRPVCSLAEQSGAYLNDDARPVVDSQEAKP